MTWLRMILFAAAVLAVLSMPSCATTTSQLKETRAELKAVNPSALVNKAPGKPVAALSIAEATPPSPEPVAPMQACFPVIQRGVGDRHTPWEVLMDLKAQVACRIHGGAVRWIPAWVQCQNGAGITITE